MENINSTNYPGTTTIDELFIKGSELMKKLADKDSCVIIGRCADFILKDRKDVIKVFVYNNMENKIKRATEFYNMDKNKAKKEISRINKLRATHYQYYTDQEWRNFENYDICINSDALGVEGAADLICKIAQK